MTDASGKAIKTSTTAKFTYGVHPILPAPESLSRARERLSTLSRRKRTRPSPGIPLRTPWRTM